MASCSATTNFSYLAFSWSSGLLFLHHKLLLPGLLLEQHGLLLLHHKLLLTGLLLEQHFLLLLHQKLLLPGLLMKLPVASLSLTPPTWPSAGAAWPPAQPPWTSQRAVRPTPRFFAAHLWPFSPVTGENVSILNKIRS